MSWRLLVVSALLAGSVAAPSGPAAAEDRFSATWTYVPGEEPQGMFVGNELYLPPCVPDEARAATAEAGVIKFVMCPDHLQIESVATASDITFYPAFSPDRHTYVVHVADSVSEVRFDPIFRTLHKDLDVRDRPGFAYLLVGGTAVADNKKGTSSASVKLSPGVTTVEIGANQWFMRYGPSQAEYDRLNGESWWRDSGKLARTRYSLQLVWKSPDTPLVAPDEPAQIGTVDYDTDDDGLVEVSTLAQLEAVRWDADGDGYSDHGGPLHVGFPNALARMGCPSSGCVGYELAADLDFDTNASGDADSGDDYWNSGHGWVPIGADTDHFSGVFEGNGHTISNLFIDSNDVTQAAATGYWQFDRNGSYVEQRSIHLGLFEELARGGVIRNVGLADVSVTRTFPCLDSAWPTAGDLCDEGRVGALVGVSAGTIRGSWVTGTVSNHITQGTGLNDDLPAVVGGLVGQTHSSSVIAASFASADVSATVTPRNAGPSTRVGGLVGINAGAITAAYVTGTAHSGGSAASTPGIGPKHVVGGLVGHNSGSIAASYVSNTVSGGSNHPLVRTAASSSRVHHSYWDADIELGWRNDAGGTGKTTAELQAPTDYTGIYANWNVDLDGDGNADDPWSFGTSSDYPTLTGVGPGSNQQQRKTATYSVSGEAAAVEGQSATLTVTLSEPAPKDGVQFAVTAGSDGSASAGDVGTITSPVTASQGDTTLEVSIPTVADAIDEDDETFTVTVTALTDGWAAAGDGQNTATVTIIDDDTAAVTVTAADPISVDEGATATYTIALASQPTAEVTVAATSSDAAVSVSPASHTFTTANWSAAATFTVTADGDDDTDDHTVTVGHQITTTDPEYATASAASVTVAVTDTTPPNQAPTVASPIADIDDLAAGDTRELSLAGVFDDADGDSLTITAESSNNAVATVSAAIDGTTNAVTAITVIAATEGTTTITVTAQDTAGNQASDTFDVTVTTAVTEQQQTDPELPGPVTALELTTTTAAVSVTAADPVSIDEGATATYTVVLASQPTAEVTVAATSSDAAVSVSPASHTFTAANWSAAATFTVTAAGDDDTDDHTVTVSHQITTTDPEYASASAASVTVAVTDTTPPNQAPTVASPIADIDDLTVGDTREVSLAGVFDDADGDSLAVTAESSNNAVATVSAAIDGTTNAVTAITVIAATEGTTIITVTAQDTAGNQASDTFDVTVTTAEAEQQADPALPGPVTALELTSTHNSVTVSWQPPEVGEAPTRYIVHLRPEGGNTGSGKTKNPKAKKTQVTFDNLKPGATYNVWVRAQNQAGKGDRVNDTITLPEE